MSGEVKFVLAVLCLFYIILGAIFIASLWDAAKKENSEEGRRAMRAHAARMSLVVPFWLPIIAFTALWDLIKMAELWPEKPKFSVELCPECKKKIKRGPMR